MFKNAIVTCLKKNLLRKVDKHSFTVILVVKHASQ